MTIRIANRSIGADHQPFVIAEMSGNHNQSLERALKIVEAAATAGADAIKLQTYTADTMTLDVRGRGFEIGEATSLWSGKNLHDLYREAYTPWEWHQPIMDHARRHGLICFSSPFDETAVDFLTGLDVPAFKIASFENSHLPLIAKAASTGKPLIISTGLASLGELSEAVDTARRAGCTELILLKCTSTYPASPRNTNLRTIPHLRKMFNCEVGLSDHTHGSGAAIASIALGARVVEKHFTLSRADGGVDSAFSIEPKELRQMTGDIRNAWEALGGVFYGATESEIPSLQFRRSIYASRDIFEGEVLSPKNICIVRPSGGMPPKFYPLLLGKRSPKSFTKGEPLSFDAFF